jgi:hypothetical protein
LARDKDALIWPRPDGTVGPNEAAIAIAAPWPSRSWPGSGHCPWYDPTFTDLARALLTTRVDVTKTATAIYTRIDEGTELRRVLRTRELPEELADLERRQREIGAELATLGAEMAWLSSSR